MKKLLIIGLVWPEPTSSAAGTRMIQLINLFLKNGYSVTFASAAAKSEFSYHFDDTAVEEQSIKLNDSGFNTFLQELRPHIVMFDRFMAEEQYGWRVQQECPDALTILDTEDLHCLRYARQQHQKPQQPFNLFSDTAKREIAAILRCDLSLIISSVEMDILQQQFKIDPSLLCYLPFLEERITPEQFRSWPTFEDRADFIFIGNFLHEPNWNTVQILKNTIWPALRKKIPGANLHIYGAYAGQKVLQLHQDKERFSVLGRAENARETMAKHRLLLAPIAFGAGVKGKLIDAMHAGTPSITTSVGAEAMQNDLPWNGVIEDDLHAFTDHAVRLYQDKDEWLQAQQHGIQMINQHYANPQFAEHFIEKIKTIKLEAHRQQNFIGQILHHHAHQSTRYLSCWIEEKNKKSS